MLNLLLRWNYVLVPGDLVVEVVWRGYDVDLQVDVVSFSNFAGSGNARHRRQHQLDADVPPQKLLYTHQSQVNQQVQSTQIKTI